MKSRLLPLRMAASLAGAFLCLAATSRYGAGVTPDSAQYIAAARSLLAGGGLLQYDGSPYAIWPPLYPALLAATAFLTRLDPLPAARYVGAAVFGLLILCGSGWLDRAARSSLLAGIGTVLIAVLFPLVMISSFAWTESLFCLFVVLFLTAIERSLSPGGAKAVLPAVLAAGAAGLTRYIGVALVPVGLLILQFGRGHPSRKLRSMALFTGVAAAPLILWGLRNQLVTSTFTGERAASTRAIRFNIESVLTTLASWLIPLPGEPRRLVLLASGLLVLLLGALVAVVLLRRGANPSADATPINRSTEGDIRPALVFTAFYVVYLTVTAAFVDMDVIGDRLLSPVAVPLVWIVVYTLDRLRLPVGAPGPHPTRFALSVLLLLAWTAWSGIRTAELVRTAAKRGAGGYSIESWQSSDLVNRLRREPLSGRVYSNIPVGLYLATGIPCRWTPVNAKYTGPNRDRYDWNRFRTDLAEEGESYVVWFEEMDKPYLVPLSDIDRAVRLEPVIEARDGAVYRVAR